MGQRRKSKDDRAKDLRLAMHRIIRRRAHDPDASLSISSVAREAGVSGALIHNHHQDIAEEIRAAQGRDSRSRSKAKNQELKEQQERYRDLLIEGRQRLADLRALGSLYLMAVERIETLESSALHANVKEIGIAKGARIANAYVETKK
jgi:AcrR family transcriptional regulator